MPRSPVGPWLYGRFVPAPPAGGGGRGLQHPATGHGGDPVQETRPDVQPVARLKVQDAQVVDVVAVLDADVAGLHAERLVLDLVVLQRQRAARVDGEDFADVAAFDEGDDLLEAPGLLDALDPIRAQLCGGRVRGGGRPGVGGGQADGRRDQVGVVERVAVRHDHDDGLSRTGAWGGAFTSRPRRSGRSMTAMRIVLSLQP